MSVEVSHTKTAHKRQIVIAALLSLISGIGLLWWLSHIYSKRSLVPAVAVVRSIVSPAILEPNDLKIVYLPAETRPAQAFIKMSDVVGRLVARDLGQGSLLSQYDLVYQRDPSSAATLVPLGKFGFVLSSSWLNAPVPQVKKNDFLTVYVAIPPSKVAATNAGVIIKSAAVLAVTADHDSTVASVLLALDDASVTRLVQARTSQFPLVAVVESALPSVYTPAPISATSTP